MIDLAKLFFEKVPKFFFDHLPRRSGISRLEKIAFECDALATALELQGAPFPVSRLKLQLSRFRNQPPEKIEEENIDEIVEDIEDRLIDLDNLSAQTESPRSTFLEQQKTAKELRAIALRLRNTRTKKQIVRRAFGITAAVTVVGFALFGGSRLLESWKSWKRSSRARTEFVKANVKRMDGPYTIDTWDSGLAPSANWRVVDREFKLIRFNPEFPAAPREPGERIANVESTVARLSAFLAQKPPPPAVIIKGRLGEGMGYVPAHLFSRLLENALNADNFDASFAGYKRWVFTVDQTQLQHFSDATKYPVDDFRKFLLDKAKKHLLPETLTDEAIFENSIIIFNNTPTLALAKLLPILIAAAEEWFATMVVSIPIQGLTGLNSLSLQKGIQLELLAYKDDVQTLSNLATVSLTHYLNSRKTLARDSGHIQKAAAVMLSDPFAPHMLANWRISRHYIRARFEGVTDLASMKPLSPVDSTAVASTAVKAALDAYVNSWLGELSNKSPLIQFSRLTTLIRDALLRSGSNQPFTDTDCYELIIASGIVERGSVEIENVRLVIKGSPFFKSDSNGEMTWLPFTPNVSQIIS